MNEDITQVTGLHQSVVHTRFLGKILGNERLATSRRAIKNHAVENLQPVPCGHVRILQCKEHLTFQQGFQLFHTCHPVESSLPGGFLETELDGRLAVIRLKWLKIGKEVILFQIPHQRHLEFMKRFGHLSDGLETLLRIRVHGLSQKCQNSTEDIIMQNAPIRLMPMQITNPEWVAVLTIFLLLPRVLLQQEEIQEAPHGKDIGPRIAHALKNLVGLEPVAARRPPRLLLRGVRGYVGKTDELCTPAYNLCPFNPHVVGVNVV